MIVDLTPTVSLPYTNNGITYSDAGNGKIQVSGTATGNSSLYYYNNRSALPSWFRFDTQTTWYQNKTGTGTTRLRMYMYDSSNTAHSIFYSTAASGSFNVASSTGYVGLALYTYITRGTTVNAVIDPSLDIATEYVPRLNSQGIAGSRWYEWGNPFYLAGYGMPNCTAYAFGRAWEIADPNDQGINYPPLSTGNADSWYNHADNWPRGSTPQLGAIACYSGGIFSGDGHVCVVEEIDTVNQRCRVSESAYNGYYFRATHWISYNGDYGYGGYTFQGFIYNPYAGSVPGPPGPVEGFDIWKFNQLINKRKGVLLT